MAGQPIDLVKRDAIRQAIMAGESYRSIARHFNVSTGSVAAVAASDTERVTERSAAKNARADYDLARRIDLLNRGFAKLADQLETEVTTPSKMQSWSISLGILIDKRRLEDGDVTSRTEDVSGQDDLDFITRRIDELAERRRAQDVSAGVVS